MMVQEIDGQTYTKIDEDTYRDSKGGEWVRWEHGAMIAKIQWAEKEMARLAGHLDGDEDAASVYLEALEIKAETEEDLRIIEELWAL